MKNPKHTIPSAVIGLVAILASLSSINFVEAGAVYGDTCHIFTLPYDPSAGSDTLNNDPNSDPAYQKVLNDTNCDAHLKYTKFSNNADQYQPQPPPNTDDVNSGTPIANGYENLRVPFVNHYHEYFNDKTQDANFIYKSFMDKFEITIQPDNSNLDLGSNLSTIKCWTGIPNDFSGSTAAIDDCDGTVSDLFGGTKVSKKVQGNTIKILWEFAQNSPNIGRPQNFGDDGTMDSYIKSGSSIVAQVLGLNTSNPYNRGTPFGVVMKSANNSADVWSVTTTSRALVADLAMRKASYNANHQNTAQGCTNSASPGDPSNLGWCYLTPSGYPTQTVVSNGTNRTFYWYPIGSVATVWKKPPPPPQAACVGLTIVDKNNPSYYDAAQKELIENKDAYFEVTPQWSGAGTHPDLDYKWQATTGSSPQFIPIQQAKLMEANLLAALPPAGQQNIQIQNNQDSENLQFQQNPNLQIVNPGDFQDFKNAGDKANPYTDRDNDHGSSSNDVDTYYSGGTAGTHIKVVAVLKGTNTEVPACKGALDVVTAPPPPAKLACKSIDAISPNAIALPDADNTFTTHVHLYDENNPSATVSSTHKATVQWSGTNGGFGIFNLASVPEQQSYTTPYTVGFHTNAGVNDASVTAQVTAITSSGNETVDQSSFANCITKLKAEKPPQGPVCTSFQILQNGTPISGTINVGDATDKLKIKITAPGKNTDTDFDYKWSATKNGSAVGNFTSIVAPLTGNPKNALKPGDQQNYATGTEGTTVTAQAFDQGSNPIKFEPACQASFTFVAPPQENVCTSLGLTLDGVAKNSAITVGPSENHLIKVAPKNVNTPNPANVHWTQTGSGALTLGPTSATLNAWDQILSLPPECLPSNFTDFTVPSACDYFYTTPSTGGGTVTVTAVQNASVVNKDISACTLPITFTTPPQNNECTGLTPQYTPANSNNLCVTPNGTVSGQYNWTVNGVLQPNHIKCQPINKSTDVWSVQAIGATSLCSANGSPSPTPPGGNQCTYKNPTYNSNTNQLCLNTGPGSYNGEFQWTINTNGNIQTINNGNDCESGVSPNSTVNVQGPSAVCSLSNYIPPSGGQCQYLQPSVPLPNTGMCVNPVGQYNGGYTWTITQNGQTSQVTSQPGQNCLNNLAPGQTITNVYATNAPACMIPSTPTPPPPNLVKTVTGTSAPENNGVHGGLQNPLTMVPNTNGTIEGKTVQYKISFTSNGNYTDATITDTMNQGYIQGYVNGSQTVVGGRINYDDHFTPSGIQACDASQNITTDCFDLVNTAGLPIIHLHRIPAGQTVAFTYQGVINGTQINSANCGENGTVCEEKYRNDSNSPYTMYTSPDVNDTTSIVSCYENQNGNGSGSSQCSVSASAIVQSFCQYILTRAAGDIYLETDLNFGRDISVCSEYKTSTGPVFTPAPTQENTVNSTGAGGTVDIGHSICNNGLEQKINGNNEQLYGGDVAKNISSEICEVKLRPGQSWDKSSIASTIEENKTRVSRWSPNLGDGTNQTITNFDDATLNGAAQGESNVYHIKNANLTLGTGSPLVLTDGQGAKTFIVEDGNLIINSDIKYASSSDTSVRNTASLAFIVLNGNVYVDPSVKTLSGVFFVQQGPGNKTDSATGLIKAKAGADSFTNLTIIGSIYGDIQDLFTHHKFAGDPSANEGSIVIRFDERIILNTPPGLQDVLQLQENQVAQ